MVVVSVVAGIAAGSGEAGVVGVKAEGAEDVLGSECGGTVCHGHVGDVVEYAGGLCAVHEGSASADEFDAIDDIERRGVIGFGVAERVAVDGDTVFEDLEELGAVGGTDSAEAEADERGGFLGVEEAGGHGEGLPIVVGLDFRERVEIDDGGALSGEDVLSFDGFWERVLDDAIVFGFSVDGEGVEGPRGTALGCLREDVGRENRCAEEDL